MKTSAPGRTSLSVPSWREGLVFWAIQLRYWSSPSCPACTAPLRPQPMISPAPWAFSSRMIALPAAPTPDTTIRQSSIRLSSTRSAFDSAASTTIAVPCWSSWKTGMSSISRSRASISKQRGAAMSSRLIPP